MPSQGKIDDVKRKVERNMRRIFRLIENCHALRTPVSASSFENNARFLLSSGGGLWSV